MAAVTQRQTAVRDSIEAVRRVREFLAAQGYLGEIASNLLFVLKVDKAREDGREYYLLVARVPEMGPDGRMRIRTYMFKVDAMTGDVTGEPLEEGGARHATS